MTSHLLDSNVLILALRSQPTVLDWLDAVGSQDLHGISVVTRTEILAGMRPYEEERTIDLIESFVSFPVTPDIADRAGRWIYQYARRGITLSFPDSLIAATALAHGLTLVTTNNRHFPMEGLQVLPLDAHS